MSIFAVLNVCFKKRCMFGVCGVLCGLYILKALVIGLLTNQFCNNDNRPIISLDVMRSLKMVADDSTKDIYSKQERFKVRTSLVRKVCKESYKDRQHWNRHVASGQVLSFTSRGIHICNSPQTMSTYWKNILNSVSGDKERTNQTNTPYGDHQFPHQSETTKSTRITQLNISHPITQLLISSGDSIMFARNPFARLWSADVDHILLPDFEIPDVKTMIRLMKQVYSESQVQCSHSLTFLEFLRFVRMNAYNLNTLWQPVYRVCSPCEMRYKFIGKMETFDRDSVAIIQELGLNHTHVQSNQSLWKINEMKRLAAIQFRSGNVDCIGPEGVAKRLWNAFQYKGFIHRSIDLSLTTIAQDGFNANPDTAFIKHALRTLADQEEQHIDTSHQQNTMMQEAFRQIPTGVMDSIREIYKYDFKLFGYDEFLD